VLLILTSRHSKAKRFEAWALAQESSAPDWKSAGLARPKPVSVALSPQRCSSLK